MYGNLPTTLLLLLAQLIAQTLGSATLTPPEPTFTIQTSTGPLSSSGTGSGTTTRTATGSASSNATTSASTTTSTAQFPSLSDVPTCVSDCLASAISRVGCSSVVDVNCFCVNPQFTPELVACILANCADQLSSSENLAQQFCNIATVSPTLSFPQVPTTTTSSTSTSDATSTAPSTTSPAPTTSSAATATIGRTSGDILGLLVTAFGLMFGAYIMQ